VTIHQSSFSKHCLRVTALLQFCILMILKRSKGLLEQGSRLWAGKESWLLAIAFKAISMSLACSLSAWVSLHKPSRTASERSTIPPLTVLDILSPHTSLGVEISMKTQTCCAYQELSPILGDTLSQTYNLLLLLTLNTQSRAKLPWSSCVVIVIWCVSSTVSIFVWLEALVHLLQATAYSSKGTNFETCWRGSDLCRCFDTAWNRKNSCWRAGWLPLLLVLCCGTANVLSLPPIKSTSIARA
jgi:hypothetical protein